MTQTPYALMARLTKTHGLKGEVVAVPAGDLTSIEGLGEALVPGAAVHVVPPVASMSPLRVASVRKTPKGLLVSFEGIDDINAAGTLAGHSLLMLRTDINEGLLAHETEQPDSVIGLPVYDEVHGDLGEITEVIITGANDVWVLDGPYGEVLLPVIEQVVMGRDEDGAVVVRLLEGLLPEDEEIIEDEEE